jgi:hypothetical protein
MSLAPKPFGHASPVILAAWEENSKKLNNFQKPAIASQSRVFRFLTKTKKERENRKEKRKI